MARQITEEELETTIRYLGTKMRDAKINPRNPYEVIRFMLLNPLPDHVAVVAELKAKEEEEKVRRIALLHEELAKLEGE